MSTEKSVKTENNGKGEKSAKGKTPAQDGLDRTLDELMAEELRMQELLLKQKEKLAEIRAAQQEKLNETREENAGMIGDAISGLVGRLVPDSTFTVSVTGDGDEQEINVQVLSRTRKGSAPGARSTGGYGTRKELYQREFLAGKSPTEIAREQGTSSGAVYRAIKELPEYSSR